MSNALQDALQQILAGGQPAMSQQLDTPETPADAIDAASQMGSQHAAVAHMDPGAQLLKNYEKWLQRSGHPRDPLLDHAQRPASFAGPDGSTIKPPPGVAKLVERGAHMGEPFLELKVGGTTLHVHYDENGRRRVMRVAGDPLHPAVGGVQAPSYSDA